jgi:hypothetical protein
LLASSLTQTLGLVPAGLQTEFHGSLASAAVIGLLYLTLPQKAKIADLIRSHRHQRRSHWRLLEPPPSGAARPVHLPNGDTFTRLAAGFGRQHLLSRCQRHLADHGSTIVVVTATQPGTDGASYNDHEQVLLPAAQTEGLHHLHDIVPIDAADGRDTFTYSTDQRSTRVTDSSAPRQDRVTTLVVFGHPGRRP